MRSLSILALVLVLAPAAFGSFGGDFMDQIDTDFHVEGDVTALAYPMSAGGPTTQSQTQERLQLSSTFKYQRNYELVFNPVFQADPWNPSISERYWADLPEGYVQAKRDSWTVQAGFNTFTWGVTDGYNPLDVVSARRYQDPLRSDKLGAPSLAIKKDFLPFTFEGIYIPWQRQTILPGIDSRWLPRQVLNNRSTPSYFGESTSLILPSDFYYNYYQNQEYDSALENNYGFRLQGESLLPGLDASLAYFEGAAPTPATNLHLTGTSTEVFPEIILQLNPEIDLIPVYYRQRVYGGSLVYANFDMIFRFETAITRVITKTPGVPGAAEEYVFGAEHSFPLGNDSLTGLFQASYARHSEPLDNTTASLNRIFDRALMLGGRYSFSEQLTTLFSALYDTESHDEMVHLEGTYGLSDTIKLTLAGDGIWGSPSTPLGVYSENDRVITGIKAMF